MQIDLLCLLTFLLKATLCAFVYVDFIVNWFQLFQLFFVLCFLSNSVFRFVNSHSSLFTISTYCLLCLELTSDSSTIYIALRGDFQSIRKNFPPKIQKAENWKIEKKFESNQRKTKSSLCWFIGISENKSADNWDTEKFHKMGILKKFS